MLFGPWCRWGGVRTTRSCLGWKRSQPHAAIQGAEPLPCSSHAAWGCSPCFDREEDKILLQKAGHSGVEITPLRVAVVSLKMWPSPYKVMLSHPVVTQPLRLCWGFHCASGLALGPMQPLSSFFSVLLRAGPLPSPDSTLVLLHSPSPPAFWLLFPAPLSAGMKTGHGGLGATPLAPSIPSLSLPILLLHHFQQRFPAFPFP